MRRRAEAALVANTLIWGSTFVIVKEALRDVSPVLFLALRFTVASLALLALFDGSWSHPRKPGWSIRGGAVAGLFLFAGYAFQTIGLQFTTAPKSAFLTGLTTAIVPILGSMVWRKMPGRLELAGVAVASGGMALMTFPAGLVSVNRGDLLTICCAVCFAAHILTLGHYSAEASVEVLSTTQIAVSAILAWLLFRWIEVPHIRWTASVWVAIAITGLLATALAFTFQAWAQQYTTSTRTAVIFTLEPVFAWVTSYLLTRESLSPRAAAGAVLILAGILLVEVKLFHPRTHPSK